MFHEFKVSFILTMTRMFYIEKSVTHGFLYLYLSLWLICIRATSADECDQTKCKGPIMYYNDLNCTPVYEKQGDCCAIRYNCSNLSGRSPDKCYANGHEYSIGEKLKDEDRSNPCDVECTCSRKNNGEVAFTCATVDCYETFVEEGCYLKSNPKFCCDKESSCPTSKEEIFKCEVDGIIYMDGQKFYPSKNPGLVCQCMKGYKGNNVQPFCRNVKCGIEMRHSVEKLENCVPIFGSSEGLQNSCPFNYRCQNNDDTVLQIVTKYSLEDKFYSNNLPDEMLCIFGNLTMKIGDELNQATNGSSECVRCVCEVPPKPSCEQLLFDECS